MKIVIISNLYEPYSRGGAEKVVGNLIDGLSSTHETILITTKPKGFGRDESINGRKKIYRFRPINLYYYLNDYKHNVAVRLIWHFFDQFNLHSYLKIRKILKDEKPDLIISHNLMGIGLLIPLALKKYRWIHTLHDAQLIVPSGLISKGREEDFTAAGFLTKFYAWINKKIFGSPVKVISPSRWLLDFHVNRGFFKNSKKSVILNPAVMEPVAEHRRRSDKTLNLLFLGQIEEHKGIFFLVDQLKHQSFDFNLKIAGAGSKAARLRSIINGDSRFDFLGKVAPFQVKILLDQCDFLMVPSLCYENSPTVIYEAFSRGVPVIASNIGGISELVLTGQTGYLFHAGDQQTFREALDKANKPDQYESLSQNCLKLMSRISIDAYINDLLA